ncbi:MAG: hypothetical protein VX346_00750 [Planctomycetota bacterium]|nr:hypothetical protein [Planctomycetota bacterium]
MQLQCAKGRQSCSRPQRLLELERLEGRDLLAADAVSPSGQLPLGSAEVLCEADRWRAEVAYVSLDATSGVAVESVVGETEPRPCRWLGCHSLDAGWKPLPTIEPVALDTVFHQLWNTAAIESLWRNCADQVQVGGNLDLSLQEMSRLEPISPAPWFAPSLPRLAAPLAPVAPDDWGMAFSRCYADLPVWEIPDRLLLQASLVENFERFSSCDPQTASEFAELIFQQAEEVLEQPEVADWLDGDWIPSWLQAGALAGCTAAIGTTIWYGVPEWEQLAVAGSFAVDCAEILAGSRIELPTILDGGEGGSLRWRLNGEYWPFGADGTPVQENSAALGFSGRACYLSDQRHVRWTGDIALGFDRTGIQAGYFDLSGSLIENPAQIDLVVTGSYGDGPGFADGVGQLSVGLSGSGPLPLTTVRLTDWLRFAGRVEYACEMGSQREQRSEFAIWGSLRAEY